MAFIYKITNLINNKCYIGKTNETIERRWQDHKLNCLKESKEKRPLYSAMRKYGIQNFVVEEIENCSSEIVEEREIYWIKHFQSYSNGYNATFGGDGKQIYDYDLIVSEYQKLNNINEVSRKLGCCIDTVSSVLKERQINYCNIGSEVSGKKSAISVEMYDLQDKFIKKWDSMAEAGRWIQSLKPETRKSLSSIVKNISQVCKNKRKIAYNYKWEYAFVAE